MKFYLLAFTGCLVYEAISYMPDDVYGYRRRAVPCLDTHLQVEQDITVLDSRRQKVKLQGSRAEGNGCCSGQEERL